MILNIFVYKSRFSCPFFYRKPPSADVFINKNRSFNVFCLLFPSDTTREGAKNKQKTVRANIFVYFFVNSSRSKDSRRRPGAENERERPVPLLKKTISGVEPPFRDKCRPVGLFPWVNGGLRALVDYLIFCCAAGGTLTSKMSKNAEQARKKHFPV